MYYLSNILIGILPWVPWLPRCSKNLVRSCQDSQDGSKRINPRDVGRQNPKRETFVAEEEFFAKNQKVKSRRSDEMNKPGPAQVGAISKAEK